MLCTCIINKGHCSKGEILITMSAVSYQRDIRYGTKCQVKDI